MRTRQNSFSLFCNILPLVICNLSISSVSYAQSQGMEGFYATFGNKIGFLYDMTTVVEVGVKGLWLQPDGRFAQTEAGMTGDFDTYCNEYPKNCGRYEISNGKYTSWKDSYPDDEPETESFTQQGDDLIIGEVSYKKIPPVSDLRLEGDYRMFGSSGTVHSFGQDGSYVRTFKDNVRTGSYKIDGYTVSFFFDDGETETEAFFMIENLPVMDSDLYEKLD